MTTSTMTYPPRPVVDRSDLPPGPPELPVIGQTLRYVRDPIRFMLDSARYGDLVTLSVKPALLLMVNHPDLIRDVVVTNHRLVGRGPNTDVLKYAMGEGLVTAGPVEHLQQRRLMQPQFHRGRVEGYGELMRDYAAHHREAWSDGQRVNMAREMGSLTLRVVVKTLFGLELPDDVRRIGEAFELINNYLVRRVNQPPKLRRLMHRLPVPYTVRFRRARAELDRIIFGLISERRERSTGEDDLLSLLLDARLEDDEGVGQPLTDQQVRDQTITMFAAGHETTAVCLTWTWFLLATNPDAQRRFHEELDEVLGDRAPELSDLANLTYMDKVLAESLRLYPPIWFWSRMSFQPFDLGGYGIPPGALLAAPQLVIQRDARWFEEPLAFRPERWTDEFREGLPRFAYYPFGGGPRQCIGEGFAMMEAKLILATLGQQWKVRHDPRHKAEMLPLISLRPKGGMPIFLERRANK